LLSELPASLIYVYSYFSADGSGMDLTSLLATTYTYSRGFLLMPVLCVGNNSALPQRKIINWQISRSGWEDGSYQLPVTIGGLHYIIFTIWFWFVWSNNSFSGYFAKHPDIWITNTIQHVVAVATITMARPNGYGAA
jgi:hypothetical protein